MDKREAIKKTENYVRRGYQIHRPGIKPKMHRSFAEYKKGSSSTINHFYEKLLLLKDRMHTETAKLMAERRHKFMEQFLQEFFKEWQG